MPVIPLFLAGASGGLGLGTEQGRKSAYNWCNAWDDVLPPADSSVSSLDRAQLWGMYSGIPPAAPSAAGRNRDRRIMRFVGGNTYV